MADKIAEKAPEKPAAKTPARNTSKVFDVSKPGKQAAATTSRPVLVSNRPIMQDPMMLSNATMAESADQSSPSRSKLKIQPLTAEEKKTTAASPKKEEKAKTSGLPTAIKLADESDDKDTGTSEDNRIKVETKTAIKEKPVNPFPEELPSGEQPAEKKSAEAIPTAAAPATAEPAPETAEDTADDSSPAAEADQAADGKASQSPEEEEIANPLAGSEETSTDAREEGQNDHDDSASNQADTDTTDDSESAASSGSLIGASEAASSSDSSASEGGVNEKAAAELEADAKKQAALDELVENKTYFLPINSVEKRRSTIVSVLGAVLILVLGLFLVNLLMDVGTLTIDGIKPVTHFFGN